MQRVCPGRIQPGLGFNFLKTKTKEGGLCLQKHQGQRRSRAGNRAGPGPEGGTLHPLVSPVSTFLCEHLVNLLAFQS